MTRTYISIILAGLLLTALWGCGSSNSGAPAFMAGTHPTGWSAGISHGKASLDLAKREQCTECHGRDLRGGISKVSCYACHGTYPHPAGWEDPAQHGASYLLNPAQCRACHGQDLQGGISGVSCGTCHPSYPHPAGWVAPTQHGAQYLANPQECKKCHGQDLQGGISGVSCTKCHQIYPHPAGWVAPLVHGPQYGANTQSCTPCHGQALPSCLACHPSPVHDITTWDTAHGKNAKLPPGGTFDSFFTCQNCHGTRFTGTPVSGGITCLNISCHKMTGYVGIPPHSGSWNDPYKFTVSTHTTTDRANAPVCYLCHDRVQGPHFWLDAAGKPTDLIPTMLTPLSGNPDPNAAPDCFNNTLCHGQK